MGPEDNPADFRQSFPCECGGTITEDEGVWSCDKCDFERKGAVD